LVIVYRSKEADSAKYFRQDSQDIQDAACAPPEWRGAKPIAFGENTAK